MTTFWMFDANQVQAQTLPSAPAEFRAAGRTADAIAGEEPKDAPVIATDGRALPVQAGLGGLDVAVEGLQGGGFEFGGGGGLGRQQAGAQPQDEGRASGHPFIMPRRGEANPSGSGSRVPPAPWCTGAGLYRGASEGTGCRGGSGRR